MIENDMQILQHWIENWQKQIPDYISKFEDRVISRAVYPVRKVGSDVLIDVVERFDRTGAGATIAAKGAVPKGSGFTADTNKHEIFQILDGFLVNDKDLKLDSKIKSRAMEIVLRNIQRIENKMALLGDADHSIMGVKGAAEANPAGTYTSIVAAWGTATADPYRDILNALQLMDPDFEPAFIIGNRKDLNHMWAMDPNYHNKFVDLIAPLFGKSPTADWKQWAIPVGDDIFPTGYVYLTTKDPMASEFIVSENASMRAIPMQRGGNYPIEVFEWVTTEIHDNKGFVKLKTA